MFVCYEAIIERIVEKWANGCTDTEAYIRQKALSDVVFKSGGNWGVVPVAVVESLFIFTLGSEVMFTIAGGFVLESLNEFMLVVGQFVGMVLSSFANFALGEVWGMAGVSSKLRKSRAF